MIDVDPVEEAYITYSEPSIFVFNIAVKGNYAYVASDGKGLRIVKLW